MAWAFSCLQLKAMHHDATLYASTNAAKLLIDNIGLPYSEVHITHDNLYMPNENLWAIAKVVTYSLQRSPFVHLDGDVFLFEPLPPSLMRSDLIAQNTEEATG